MLNTQSYKFHTATCRRACSFSFFCVKIWICEEPVTDSSTLCVPLILFHRMFWDFWHFTLIENIYVQESSPSSASRFMATKRKTPSYRLLCIVEYICNPVSRQFVKFGIYCLRSWTRVTHPNFFSLSPTFNTQIACVCKFIYLWPDFKRSITYFRSRLNHSLKG